MYFGTESLIFVGAVACGVVLLFLLLVGGLGRHIHSTIRLRPDKSRAAREDILLELFARQKRVTNNDVETLLGVSDATATRYLDELEQSGVIEQVGTTGRSVYYQLK